MESLDVKIVHLDPMLAASAYSFGPSPEEMAQEKMVAFLKSKGLLDGYGPVHPCYGFNNPSPSVGSPNYGYEILVPVEPGTEPEGDIRIIYFAGGLYAVTHFEGLEHIGQVWQQLVIWRERSGYKEGYHQCLERLLNPLEPDPSQYSFDLYLSIV